MARKAAKPQEEARPVERAAVAGPRDELRTMIRARTPIINIRAWDTADVVDWIAKLAAKQDKFVLVWSSTRGLEIVNTFSDADGNIWRIDYTDKEVFVQRTDDKAGSTRRRVGEPAAWGLPVPRMSGKLPPTAVKAAIEFVVPDGTSLPGNLAQGRAIVIVMRYGTYLGNPEIQQWIEDAYSALQSQQKTIVMLAPDTDVPPTLGKLIKSFDWPYPTYEELADVVIAYADSLSSRQEKPVKLTDEDLDRLVKSLQGMTMREADASLKKLIVSRGTLAADETSLRELRKHKQEVIKAQGGVLEYVEVDASTAQIGGVDLLKKYIEETAVSSDSGMAEFTGGYDVSSRGVLLGGPPGTGKSLSAKAIAYVRGEPLVRLDMGAIFGPLLGSSEATLRNALATVEAIAPCVFWMDEVEKGFSSNGGDLDGGASQRVLATMLTWLQERAKQNDVFIVATCNWIDNVDPAFQQRMTERFFIDLPGPEARDEIIRLKLAERGRPDAEAIGLDMSAFVNATQWFSPREIEAAIDEAYRRAYLRVRRDGTGDIVTDDVMGAFSETVPLAHQRRAEIARMRAWGETARQSSSEKFDGATEELLNRTNAAQYANNGDGKKFEW